MKLMLRNEWRLWPFNSFLGVLDIKTGVTISLLFAVLNKVAGVYGLIAALTGAGGSFAQISLYIYSVIGLVALAWGLKVVKAEDARQSLYLAHLFCADYVLSTSWTAYFAVMWWWHTPHDGAGQANSPAQEDMIAVAQLTGPALTEAERAQAALLIWNQEKHMAFAVILISWLSKIYFALLIYSYAVHLRKGSYRALARTQPPRSAISAQPLDLADEEDEEIEDFYRVPLRQPPTPTKHTGNHLKNNSASSFADFVGDNNQKRTRTSNPAASAAALPHSLKKAPEEDEDEVLFDDDYRYASSGSTSKTTSKRGTESSTSRSASTDNEEAADAGERTSFIPGRNAARSRA
ncbi:Inositolphosphorylceramide synthase subunit Kei1-domain-containing protein [Mycena rosella]|uniref:Inositolphosphorylceramide synthase subunit Kei1-domain-containing protein n=1 Tax=Mycena rosella TaxID=1033263 RepID=A0AAD7BXV3_MYCRO|nr:Inositolphosphorylceramide synthase subunit Kei1-domain-containing protein [Mycena rosella]